MVHRPTTLWALYNFRIRLKPFRFYFPERNVAVPNLPYQETISNGFFFEAVEKSLQGHDMVLLLPTKKVDEEVALESNGFWATENF